MSKVIEAPVVATDAPEGGHSVAMRTPEGSNQANDNLQNNEQAKTQQQLPKQEVTLSLPYKFARHNHLLLEQVANTSGNGSKQQQNRYCLYFEKPPSAQVLSEIQRSIGFIPPLQQVTNHDTFNTMLQAHYSAQTQSSMVDSLSDEILDLDTVAANLEEPDDLLNSQDEAPIIRLLNAIFFEAIRSQSSDIHIQPREYTLEVRFRLDGVLHTKLEQPVKIAPLIVSRIKVLAKLDIAEKRLPQDGRIALKIGGRNIDMRVSTMPSAFGERVVMRLLDKSGKAAKLGGLGIDDHVLKAIRQSIKRPHGIVLVTGPTGSGKTTTLYGALAELDSKRLNIMTIEDPIEYYFDGISQTQINMRAEMTFARGLRAILRQDPDVVMIGEIRDYETADIAIQASLTGHLMLSTLHTNTAVGAITRLVDMGLASFLIASTLYAVLSQRLVRMLCPHCKEKAQLSDEHQALAKGALANYRKQSGVQSDPVFYDAHPDGCTHCFHTGYQGRVGIYEILLVDDTMRSLIHDNTSEGEITSYARKQQGAESLRDNGFGKVFAGITNVAEVLRVTQE